MKKLYILFICISLIFHYCGFAQPSPAWVARYNGPVGNDEARAMTVDANGYIYVTGPSDGSKSGNVDFATVKYDPVAGQQVWAARYNGPGNGEDWPYAIAVDGSGNVYVTGRSVTSSSGKTTDYDYATVKYNSHGGVEWTKRYGSTVNRCDIPEAIKVDAGGNVYVTGFSDAPTFGAAGNSITTIKYDPSGTELWRKVYDALPNIYSGPNPNAEQAFSIALDGAGNVYVAGTVIIKYNSSGDIIWINSHSDDRKKILVDGSNNIVTTGFNGITTKYDSSGNLLWQTTASGVGFWNMALDQTGNVYVTGEADDLNGNSSDYWTVKYDGNTGGAQWSARFNGSANSTDFARSIALDGSGNVFVTGHCTVKNGKNSLTSAGTIKYDNSGAQKWVAVYDSAAKLYNDGFAVATDVNGNVYVASQGISSSRASDYDFVTIKYSQNSSGFTTQHFNNVAESDVSAVFSLQNYPNPFYNSTTIQYQLPHDGKVKLAIYDLAGKEIKILVNEAKPAGVYKINFEAGKLSSGTYLCKIQCGDINKTKELIVLK